MRFNINIKVNILCLHGNQIVGKLYFMLNSVCYVNSTALYFCSSVRGSKPKWKVAKYGNERSLSRSSNRPWEAVLRSGFSKLSTQDKEVEVRQQKRKSPSLTKSYINNS